MVKSEYYKSREKAIKLLRSALGERNVYARTDFIGYVGVSFTEVPYEISYQYKIIPSDGCFDVHKVLEVKGEDAITLVVVEEYPINTEEDAKKIGEYFKEEIDFICKAYSYSQDIKKETDRRLGNILGRYLGDGKSS